MDDIILFILYGLIAAGAVAFIGVLLYAYRDVGT